MKRPITRLLAVIFFATALIQLGATLDASAANFLCPLGAKASDDGHRRLALIVGVSEYPNLKDADLAGAAGDAQRFYDLLTSTRGFRFPKENVCLLLNSDATQDSVVEAFERGLIDRASADDIAVFYFSGHGGQRNDLGGDESDGKDETLVLSDATPKMSTHLVDDRLGALIDRLRGKTENITLVMDACNSASNIRGDQGPALKVKLFKGEEDEQSYVEYGAAGSQGTTAKQLWSDAGDAGIVQLAASSDGEAAIEKDGAGVFTEALIYALQEPGAGELTYAQLGGRIRPLVARKSSQAPYVYGETGRQVFGGAVAQVPLAWTVADVGDTIKLEGPPLPGFGPGAELRIYDVATDAATARDPASAKATVEITESSAISASANITQRPTASSEIEEGDFAVLVRPGRESVMITASFRDTDKYGGVDDATAEAIRNAVAANEEAKRVVEFVSSGGDYEISIDDSSAFILRGPEGLIRWYSDASSDLAAEEQVMYALRRFSLHHALLAIRGEGGRDFRDNESLQVLLEPDEGSSEKCVVGKNSWAQAPANELQLIPLCKSWRVKVSLQEEAPYEIVLGGFIASSSGRLTPLLAQGELTTLKPGGKTWVSRRFKSSPPIDVDDYIVVIGTKKDNQIDWWTFLTLASEALTKGASKGQSDTPLLRALMDYVTVTPRGDVTDDGGEESTWTRTVVPIRVVAGTAFVDADVDETIDKREYTVNDFNIKPYLPNSPDSALYKVLTKADELVRASYPDGYGYRQHAWQEGSDLANMKKGIDCSRAIWFAFTRAGLPYNNTDRYLTTADMVGANSPMADRFKRCDGSKDTLQTGDILVYRDDTRGDGHVVMVIDPRNQVAWGSHGWDGNAPELSGQLTPDTGVEYQKIKYKPDWNRWDRKSMELKECWRYGEMIAEREKGSGEVGALALRRSCDPTMCLLQ